VIFSSNIIETPRSSRDGAKKRERKRKAPKVSTNKGEVNILIGERRFNSKNPFRYDPVFSPSIIPFQKPFLKSFLLTHELHIFSL
jgi:hypothetical protein